MKRLAVTIIALLLVGGCKEPTGSDWLDPLIIRDFDKRVELTNAVRRSRFSYCFYGCDHVCSIDPEPTIYRDLDEQIFNRMIEVRDRAKRSGLVFEVREKSGIIYEPRIPPELSPEEVGPAKLICLQRQRDDIEEIESLLDQLAPKGT
ncbi:hypothetical protein ACXYN8_11575 [Altererythrobacter sp. CAU 1778]